MASIFDVARRHDRNLTTYRASEMHGLVTSYDPKNHLAKVAFQPWGYESGWLTIHTSHIGKTYGIAIGLQPGNGGSQVPNNASVGNAGGSPQSSSETMGDQVIFSYQEDDAAGGKITGRVHSTQDSPLQVQSGELAMWTIFQQDSDAGPDSAQSGQKNNTGQKIFFKNDGGLYSEDGAGAAHFFDGKGNTTHNAIGTHTTQIIQQRDSSPFDSLSGQQGSSSSATPIHYHKLDKNKGVKTSAFNDQHTTTWDQNGVTHISGAKVTSQAPSIPHIGSGTFTQNLSVGQNLNVSQIVTAATYDTSSDARLKTEIAKLESMLDKVMALEPKTFLKRNVATDDDGKQSIHSDPPQPSVGYIAQDIREIFPEDVNGDESKEFLTVSEGSINVRLLAAFQEFVVEVRNELAEIKSQIKTG